jgi:hypothetical protein
VLVSAPLNMGSDDLRRLAKFLELLSEATAQTQVRADAFDAFIHDAAVVLAIRFDAASGQYRVDDRSGA